MFHIFHSEEVLPSIHADKYYPCELVGTWNTWYGEQDQAGRNANVKTSSVWQSWCLHSVQISIHVILHVTQL